jgi:hypothetical protein
LPAGADGTCVIHDGPLTITAARPVGLPDTITLTVDDGTGKPSSYTLDYSGPMGAVQLTSAQSQVGDAGSGVFGGTLDDPGDGGRAGSVALPSQRYTDSSGAGEAGLAAAPDQGPAGDSPYQQYQPAQQVAPGGGLPVLGAGGHGGGSDADRGDPRFAIAGDLFESTDDQGGPPGTAFRISGSLDDEPGSVGQGSARERNGS